MPVDQGKGNVGNCQNWKEDIQNELLGSISSQTISVQVKVNAIQDEVINCPKVNTICGSKKIPSLLHSGSQVTLIHQVYFEKDYCL